jgi:uncharacterized membrane protein
VNNTPPENDAKETGRTEAFSDGVIAIAITLLVLEIRVPMPESLEGRGLLVALAEEWPSYLAFLTSFLTVLIMWVNHHRMFTLIKRVDHNFLILNGLLLMGISLVPFTSALLDRYIGQPDQQVAAAVYAAVFTVIAIFFNVLWRYASYKNRLIDRKSDPAWVEAINRQYRFGPLMYLAAFGVAFFSFELSVIITIALAVFFALPARSDEIVRS